MLKMALRDLQMDHSQGSNSWDFIAGGFWGCSLLVATTDLILGNDRFRERGIGIKRDLERGTVLGDDDEDAGESFFFSPLKG